MAVNDWLQAEVIRHELELRKHANGVVAKIIAVLNRSDSRLFGELQAALESMDADSFSVERLEALLTSVRSLNAAAYANMERELDDVLREFVGYEAAYQRQMLITAAPVVSVAGVSTDMVYAAAMRRPFQGVLLRSVWPDLSDSRMKLIRRTIAQGFVESRTTAQIVRDLRGTKVQGYADGLVNRSRREVEAVVRTALWHYAGVTQDSVMEANSDLVKAVKWVSTLDARTSEQCRLRDGLLYEPVSHKPIGHKVPWGAGPGRLHWNAVPEGALVKTRRGDVAVEAVCVGDLVLTHTGRFMPALAKRTKLNEGGVIRVAHTESGRILRATDDHPVLTADGWKFMGALEVGDKLLRDSECFGEVSAIRGRINSESKDRPAEVDDSNVALKRTIELVAAHINLECDHEVGPGEVEDVAINLVLSNPLAIKSDQCLQHHFLALGHALSKDNRHRLSELVARVLGERFAGHPETCFGVGSVNSFGLSYPICDTLHSGGVVHGHQFAVRGVLRGGLFSEAKGPVVGSGWSDAAPGIEVEPGLLPFRPHRNSVHYGELGQTSVREPVVALDSPQGLAVDNVKIGDECGMINFAHDEIVALELQQYYLSVYDIEIAEDCSYVCDGLVVSNCRSTQAPVTKSWRELGVDMDEVPAGTRASMDGQVPAETTYLEWLGKQPAGVQDEVLGPTRAKLYRDGKLPMDRMYGDKGQWLSIDQLRARDAAAFKRAGM